MNTRVEHEPSCAKPWLAALVLAAGLIWTMTAPAWPQTMGERQQGQAATGQSMMHGQGMMHGRGMMQGEGMMSGHMMGGPGKGRQMGRHAAAHQAGGIPHVEGRLAFLRVEIGITEGQMEAWNSFADAVRKANKLWTDALPDSEQRAGGPAAGQGSWLEGLELREKAAGARLDGLHMIRSAADTLFAALSDDQKHTADTLLRGPMGLRGPLALSGPMGMAQGGMRMGPRRQM